MGIKTPMSQAATIQNNVFEAHLVQNLAHSRHLISGGYQFFFQVVIDSKNRGLCIMKAWNLIEPESRFTDVGSRSDTNTVMIDTPGPYSMLYERLLKGEVSACQQQQSF